MKYLFAFLLLLLTLSAQAQPITSSTGVPILAPTTPLMGGAAGYQWQGMGQGMKLTVQGFSNASSTMSRLVRTPHYSNVAFRYFRVVIPVSYSTCNTTCIDQLYSGAQTTLSFQVGFEYPYTAATTGLSARIPVTFSGANYVTYNNSGWTGGGYILSDVIDAGQVIPAGIASGQFGLWETMEVPAAALNVLPYTNTLSNYIQRYIGQVDSTTSQIAALGGSSDVALNATSITAATTSITGSGSGLTPAFMLIQVPTGTKMIDLDGDCLLYGNDEGNLPAWVTGTAYTTGAIVTATVSGALKGAYTNSSNCTSGATSPTGTGGSISDGACTWAYTPGTSLAGDAMGDANTNIGFGERWIGETLGLNFVNFGRGSDKFIFRNNLANWTYRLQLMELAAPTALLEQLGHNDLAASETVVAIVGYAKSTFTFISDVLPGIKMVQVAQTPSSTSTDNFSTTANQTAAANFGNSSSHRGALNDTYIRTANSGFGNTSGYCDPNPAVEFGYTEGTPASETSKWNATGFLYGWTPDGVHPNSYGHQQAAAGWVCYNAAWQLVTNPF